MAYILGAKLMTVERFDIASVDGEQTQALVDTFTIIAAYIPIAGRERQDLPELYRTRQTAKLFCQPNVILRTLALQATSSADAGSSDIVTTRDGRRHEVIRSYDWTYHDAPTKFRKYLVAEIGIDGSI